MESTIVAIVLWGSLGVPLKNLPIGDGFFFQFIMCCGIWVSSLVIDVYNEEHTNPLDVYAAFGGVLWSLGNVTMAPIIATCGYTLGMGIWGSVSMVVGWCCGFFGLFGLRREETTNKLLSVVGAVLCVISVAVMSRVSPVRKANKEEKIMDGEDEEESLHIEPSNKHEDSDCLDHFTVEHRRRIGVSLSILAGLLYGVNGVPVLVKMQHEAHTKTSSGYAILSYAHGILLGSIFMFIVYSSVFPRPKLPASCIARAFFVGALWTIASYCAFVSATILGVTISFPLVSTGPGVISSLWSVFFFKEIKGGHNISLLIAALALVITGVCCISLSR